MHSFGFIGFGKMAQMLIKGLIQYANVSPSNIAATRNDKDRLNEINEKFSNINVYSNNADVAANASYIFICAKPPEFKSILDEIKDNVSPKTHIISLAITVPLNCITNIAGCSATKLIPSITSEIGKGVTLMCHSSSAPKDAKDYIEGCIGKFSEIKLLTEEEISFASVLTSCGPGFIASIFEHFANASVGYSNTLGYEEISKIVSHTLYATSQLIYESNTDFRDVMKSVATKGGITQEGIDVFNTMLPDVFANVFKNAYNKISVSQQAVENSFNNLNS